MAFARATRSVLPSAISWSKTCWSIWASTWMSSSAAFGAFAAFAGAAVPAAVAYFVVQDFFPALFDILG